MKKQFLLHLLLLTVSIAIGVVLRFTNIELKPPWSDEWATLVFSLGHSFLTVAVDKVIDLDSLLSPLQVQPTTDTQDVINNLLTESTHPPLYFAITHWWLQLFGGNEGLVSLWWGRALSALFGVGAIAAIFGLSWLLFRCLVTAQITSALMAVSPLGVYLAQEARHYTLAILWIMASLGCLTVAIKCLEKKQSLLFAVTLSWIVVNSLGVATHYFFALTLVAETLVLCFWWWQDFQQQKSQILSQCWKQIYLAMLGTFCGCFPWIITWKNIPDNQLTSWVFDGNSNSELYAPLLRLFIWLVTMFGLLPVEGVSDAIAIGSGIIILGLIVWIALKIFQGFQSQKHQLGIKILWRFLTTAIALILIITYLFGADLTLSARFQFIYYPAVILFFGGICGYLWQNFPDKKVIIGLLIIGILGSITVSNNFAFQKVERPDLVVPIMLETHNSVAPEIPILIATRHMTHGQTGEMMSLGWQLAKTRNNSNQNIVSYFLLAHQSENKEEESNFQLIKNIQNFSRPFQLWLVNFSPPATLVNQNCQEQNLNKNRATGYKLKLYNCS